ncbi:helix-turn-helix domain-containing protein, partial [Acinetobacter baumannii]
MQQRGLTRTALATACEVSKEAVSNWLSGQS